MQALQESVDIYTRRFYAGTNQLLAIKLAHEDFNLPGLKHTAVDKLN